MQNSCAPIQTYVQSRHLSNCLSTGEQRTQKKQQYLFVFNKLIQIEGCFEGRKEGYSQLGLSKTNIEYTKDFFDNFLQKEDFTESYK